MGNSCCQQRTEFKLETQKIMKVVTKNSKNTGQLFLQIYDMENQIGKEVEINLKFLKLEGLSQLNFKNSLYLCGWDNDQNKDHNGSTFIKIQFSQPANIHYLVNSSHCHYYPSMTHFKNEYFFVIGGKNSVECEIYHINSSRWKDLAELPEERYGGILACDENTNTIYLFGGYNRSSKKIHASILKLSLRSGSNWEKIILMSDYASLLCKTNACVCKFDKNSVLIIGGKTNEEEICDDVIECTFSGNSIIAQNKLKLESHVKFDKITLACEANNKFFMIDENSNIHKFSILDQKHTYSSLFAIEEYYGDNDIY